MRVIREYKRAESLEEAWQLNQKKSNRVLGGMVWLKMGKMQIGTAIDLSDLTPSRRRGRNSGSAAW